LLLLEHIAKSYGRGHQAKDVLVDVHLALDDTSPSIGILGANKSGKTTLLNIIAGTMIPDRGRVVRRSRVSWPLSWRGFGGQMTGEEQVFLLGRMYRVDRRGLFSFVAEVSDLGAKLYEPLQTYSAGEKDRLMQATALGLDFDLYLLDGDVPGVEKEHAARYRSLLMNAFTTARIIFASSKPATVGNHCLMACILVDGQMSAVMPLAEAQNAFSTLSQHKGAAR
jgi:capsular polysaccharide transport system ATP-binding protein